MSCNTTPKPFLMSQCLTKDLLFCTVHCYLAIVMLQKCILEEHSAIALVHFLYALSKYVRGRPHSFIYAH